MIKAKKSLSQNFLFDKNISNKIVNQSNIENKIVLEIGPGYGFLTDTILDNSPKKLYLVEKDIQPAKFGSIPQSMWWSIVTLTTVGYGDVYPVTAGGKIFASIISLIGIGIVAIPTGIISASFVEEIHSMRRGKKR